MILLLDNYDSFTWNVYQLLRELGAEVCVRRNDELSAEGLLALAPEAIVISPGPGRPEAAGVTPELLRRVPPDLPLLGVCLGHQALVQHEGGTIERDPVPVHGRASSVFHDGHELFRGMPNPFAAGRYHSLRARRTDLPPTLEVTAWTEDGLVMGLRHRTRSQWGVQFHPESILTPEGRILFANFLELARRSASALEGARSA